MQANLWLQVLALKACLLLFFQKGRFQVLIFKSMYIKKIHFLCLKSLKNILTSRKKY